MNHAAIDPIAVDRDGNTPIHHAVMNGLKSMIDVLSSDSVKPGDVKKKLQNHCC